MYIGDQIISRVEGMSRVGTKLKIVWPQRVSEKRKWQKRNLLENNEYTKPNSFTINC